MVITVLEDEKCGNDLVSLSQWMRATFVDRGNGQKMELISLDQPRSSREVEQVVRLSGRRD